MAPALAELTARAQTLTSAGDLTGARAVLTEVLRSADADPRRATAELAVAAALFARVLIALGDPQSARLWAAFAHAAEEQLHGPRDERTIAAAATHAAVLYRVGQYGRAALVYHDLVGELARIDDPEAPRVLAAEADLATAEHAAGHCAAARARLTGAWRRYRDRYGEDAPPAIKMLARLGAMERECGREAAARDHLATARRLSERHLPAGHPLIRQAAELAEAERSGRHTCGRMSRPGRDDDTELRPGGFRPFPRRPTVPAPPAPDDTLDDVLQPPPDNRATDPNGTVYQQPFYLSDLGLAGDPAGRHARADTPPPLPGHRAPDYERAGRSGRGHPALLAIALAGGVATAAAVVITTLPDADGVTTPQAAAPSAAASGETAGPPGSPRNVTLRDNRTGVSLSWTVPSGATGPVVISGGRAGQPPAEVERLSPGATDYQVYRLDEQANYCFTVALRAADGRLRPAAPVCTAR
ncbi:fibronectin type III domain-containing protein [Actinoplanes oblitus]|uniref:Fibronectin type III domain-containing protein n=1 Tax=Actinoplanes oblitus TaxID=3040509 RepID=A0ABY8WDA2_9ACTN|nr:fibronectin type III domain-containing protein [Actinoplanes oblitus]WIM95028.1 fibronectin type III domain-containing protein [Actinoplanes oblitus]